MSDNEIIIMVIITFILSKCELKLLNKLKFKQA